MTEDILPPFDLPAVRHKKVGAALDGGLLSSDGGLLLLRDRPAAWPPAPPNRRPGRS